LNIRAGSMDPLIHKLLKAHATMMNELHPDFHPLHSLNTTSKLLDPIRSLANQLTPSQTDFLACLGANRGLILWLRPYHNQKEFDDKLQVARGLGSFISEPELESAIESLKRIRHVLRNVLYVKKQDRLNCLWEFLTSFSKAVNVTPKDLKDVNTLQLVGSRLLEVLDKQTKGSGVKSCYDLVDLHVNGKFELVASRNLNDVLHAVIQNKKTQNQSCATARFASEVNDDGDF
jgi:hypothetical protein